MLVTLTPGVDRVRVLELLRSASIEIVNNHGRQDRYVRWVLDQGRTLRGQIARSDLDQLLFTPGFYRLLDAAQTGTVQKAQLLEAEMSDCQAGLVAAHETLRKELAIWNAAADSTLAVVDTSVFLSHPAWTRDDNPAAVIASIPWADELGSGSDDVLLVLPEVVIRELDRLKESSNREARFRAQVTLAVVDKLLPDPFGTVPIRVNDPDGDAVTGRGEVWLRMFYDDPAHRPLDDADAEIIDRALAVQTLAGRAVQLMTMDTGMALNARRAGIAVAKPLRRIEVPPAEGRSTRAQRPARTATAPPGQRHHDNR